MLNWAKVVEEETWNLDGSAQRLEETDAEFPLVEMENWLH